MRSAAAVLAIVGFLLFAMAGMGFLLFAMASPSWGETPSADVDRGLAEWDQARVTAIAEELAKNVDALYREFYNQPPSTIGSGQANAFYRLKQLMRRVRTEGRHLAAALKDGKGHDETLPVYEHLMELVRDARVEVQRQFTSDQLLDKAAAAGDALRRLEPYYDAKALSDPGVEK
jgi:hypothetical protein